VFELKCRKIELGPFSRVDAQKFVTAYSAAYGIDVDGAQLISELEAHHLGEFAQHPLMLTLVCILKTSPNREIPRRAIGLLRRAIETLAFRWDEAKGIHRASAIPLDGEERIRLLMRIAFDMSSPQEPWSVIETSANAHLRLIQLKGINVRELLMEIARFYGILVPAGEHHWQFAHRMVHDYLSARFWVESGQFDPGKVVEWDIHAGYAASLSLDASSAMIRMLYREKNLYAFSECLYNRAPFDAGPVGRALIERLGGFAPHPALSRSGTFSVQGDLVRVRTDDDIFSVATDEFLRSLLKTASIIFVSERSYDKDRAEQGARIAAVCAIGELSMRKARIKPKQVALFGSVIPTGDITRFECVFPNRKVVYSVEDIANLVPD
jgi:hypothetical protein